MNSILKVFLSVFLIFSAFIGYSQSPFKSLPKIPTMRPTFSRATPVQPDSSITAARFVADIAAYAEPGNILMAGVGYGIQGLKYNYDTQKWNANWSVSAVAFAGGSVVPTTPASIISVGILGGVLNNTVMAGPIYNFGTKQFGVAVSFGISLNN